MIPALVIYSGLVLVMSLVCFALYGWDKRRAVYGGRRVPEKTLHLLAFLGGWPGGILAQRQFRHKTRKTTFQIAFWLTALLHVIIVAIVADSILK